MKGKREGRRKMRQQHAVLCVHVCGGGNACTHKWEAAHVVLRMYMHTSTHLKHKRGGWLGKRGQR